MNIWNCIRIFVLGLLFSCFPLLLCAHQPFQSYIQHRVYIVVSPENIDIELELTFYNLFALAERRKIDLDADERIDPTEVDIYLKNNTDTFLHHLDLCLDNKTLELIYLFDPELDLFGDNRIAPSPFHINLTLFARNTGFTGYSSLKLQDRIFSSYPAVLSWDAIGNNGIQINSNGIPKSWVSKEIQSVSRTFKLSVTPANFQSQMNRGIMLWILFPQIVIS